MLNMKPPIALDPLIQTAACAGAEFVLSRSGGKDSGAAAVAVSRWTPRLPTVSEAFASAAARAIVLG